MRDIYYTKKRRGTDRELKGERKERGNEKKRNRQKEKEMMRKKKRGNKSEVDRTAESSKAATRSHEGQEQHLVSFVMLCAVNKKETEYTKSTANRKLLIAVRNTNYNNPNNVAAF